MSMMNLENKNEFRPYHAGMSDREPSMATIVLIQQRTGTDTTKQNTLYDSFVTSVNKDGAGSGSAVTPLGSISTGTDTDTTPLLPQMGLGTEPYYGVFNNFGVTNVSEAREELVRIAMNFGGNWNAFFFGENPRVFTFQGLLLDSPEYPFYQEFVSAYDKYLSGRKCVINKMKMVLSYDGRIITGYILKLVNELTADQYMMKQFSFTVLVESEAWFRMNPKPDGTMGLNHMSNSNRYGQGAPAEVTAANPSAQNDPAATGNSATPVAAPVPDNSGTPSEQVPPEAATPQPSFGMGAPVGNTLP